MAHAPNQARTGRAVDRCERRETDDLEFGTIVRNAIREAVPIRSGEFSFDQD
jgi:hypothetical protein